MKLKREIVIMLGLKLKEARLKKNFSMEKVKMKLEDRGININKSDIGRLEKGERLSPNPLLINNLCEIYGLDATLIFQEIGYLNKTREPGNAKRINIKKVPMYGTANAGSGYVNLSLEIEEFLVPEEDYKPGRFAINVEGDSMTGPGKSIPCGSIALVDPMMCTDVEELIGKVCVFTYNDDTYIKQLIIDDQDIIRLVSFNPEISDIIILRVEELKCEGRVIKTYFEQKW